MLLIFAFIAPLLSCIDYCISVIHHIVGQDPEALVSSHLVGVLQEQARDGITHHNMITMEETTGSLIEIMQGLMDGGGTHVFLAFFSFFWDVSKDLCKRLCVITVSRMVLNEEGHESLSQK